MEPRRTLVSIPVGQRVTVRGLRPGVPRSVALRLLEMGVLPGTEVAVARAAPLGDPLHLKLRGYSLSIRRSEAQAIEVDAPSAERP